ncbi:MAG: hypothetical protein ACFFC7_05995 [Candidatus Hermodarchaeota archaeon]
MKTTPKKAEEFMGYSHFGCKSGVPYEWVDKTSKEVQEYQINLDLCEKITIDYTS